MATIRLIPSTYYLSSSSYLSVSDASNMYDNTDSTTYATITNSRKSTTSYYIYLRGFNFNAIPDNAVVSSFTVKLKARESGVSTSSSYKPYLANGTSAINGSCDAITTTATVSTFTGLSADWDTIVGYGTNFGIRINCRRASKNTTSYVYIYGAEIEVTYTVPTARTITSSINGSGTIDPSGSVTLYDGDNYILTIYDAISPTITDNNVDVTSQLVQVTSGNETLIPFDYDSSGFTVTNISNAYHDSSNANYADFTLAGRTTGDLYLDLGGASIPSSANIQSVSCTVTLQFSANGSSSSVTSSFQLYSGSTAKGSANNWVTSATDISKTTYTLTTGTWTASEVDNARFYITCYNGASSTQRHIYVYGVSFNITYEVSGTVYTYTITNISGDHIIVVNSSAETAKIYVKVNGSWIAATEVYKKVNGSWVLQSDVTTVFNSSTNYRKGN